MIPNDVEPGVARQELCRYLAACYYEPGPEFDEEKVFDSMLAAGKAIGPAFEASSRRLGQSFVAAGHERLRVDYTRLFLGPVQVLAQPYEFVWTGLESAAPESTIALESLYRHGGFAVGNDFPERPAHIAVELEFLYLLTFRENQGRQRGDVEGAGNARALRRRFLDEHLARWVDPFTAAMKAGANEDFYRELADLTLRYVLLASSEVDDIR
jgi:TorA maturation chaperone TorD